MSRDAFTLAKIARLPLAAAKEVISRIESVEGKLGSAASATAEAVASSVMARAADGSSKLAYLATSALVGIDAASSGVAGGSVTHRGGKCVQGDIGARNWGHISTGTALYASRAGRVVADNVGVLPFVDVTGIAAQTIDWTMVLRLTKDV